MEHIKHTSEMTYYASEQEQTASRAEKVMTLRFYSWFGFNVNYDPSQKVRDLFYILSSHTKYESPYAIVV